MIKKYVIQLIPSKEGVKELMNWVGAFGTPKFVTNGWNGETPLFYNGANTDIMSCYSPNISEAKLYATKQGAEQMVKHIYLNTTSFTEIEGVENFNVIKENYRIKVLLGEKDGTKCLCSYNKEEGVTYYEFPCFAEAKVIEVELEVKPTFSYEKAIDFVKKFTEDCALVYKNLNGVEIEETEFDAPIEE